MSTPRLASPKQKALIAYLGHNSPETATATEAGEFIDKAIESESYRPLLDSWSTDKIYLHPALYAKEPPPPKDSRSSSIFHYCEDDRQSYNAMDLAFYPLKKLNLKTCKRAVEWLDEGHAGWDHNLFESDEFMGLNQEVIETYFLPAIAHVAPEFIKKNTYSHWKFVISPVNPQMVSDGA